MANIGTGCSISPFDGRDLYFKPEEHGVPLENKGPIKLPWDPINQGGVPCCVSVAVVTCMEILDVQKPPFEQLAVLFHYYNTPKDGITGNVNLSDAFDTAVNTGVCPLKFHNPPFTAAGSVKKPTPEAFAEAKKFCIVKYDQRRRRFGYRRINENDVDDWRTVLSAGMGVAFAFYLTEGYYDIKKENDYVHGNIGGRPSIDHITHAVVAVDYDNTKEALLIRDSKGVDNFKDGHWWLPYSLVRHPRFIADAFTAIKITYND